MSFEAEGGAAGVVEQGQGTGGAEGAPAAGEQAQQQGGADDPIAKLMSSMETFQQGMTARLGEFEQRLPQAAPAAAAEESGAEEFDLAALLEGLPDEAFDAESGMVTPEGQMELMRQLARNEADAVRSEHAQREMEAAHDAYANQIEEKYTELQNQETQKQVLAEATRLAKQMGQPDLAANPYFFEQTYLSMAGRARAAAEVRAQDADPGVRLEQPGGGGGPVDNGDGPSAQQRIVGAATGSRFRLGT